MKTIYCRNYPAACDEAQRYDDERHAVTLQPMTCDCGEATVGFSVVCCDTGDEVLRIVGCPECCDRRRERTVTTFFTLSEPIRGIDFLFLSRRHGLHVRQRVWSHFFANVTQVRCDGREVHITFARRPWWTRGCRRAVLRLWKHLKRYHWKEYFK